MSPRGIRGFDTLPLGTRHIVLHGEELPLWPKQNVLQVRDVARVGLLDLRSEAEFASARTTGTLMRFLGFPDSLAARLSSGLPRPVYDYAFFTSGAFSK